MQDPRRSWPVISIDDLRAHPQLGAALGRFAGYAGSGAVRSGCTPGAGSKPRWELQPATLVASPPTISPDSKRRAPGDPRYGGEPHLLPRRGPGAPRNTPHRRRRELASWIQGNFSFEKGLGTLFFNTLKRPQMKYKLACTSN